MKDITIRDLSDNAEEIVERVASGERLTVIRAGKPVAEISPVPKPGLDSETLLLRRRHLPPIDGVTLHDALDAGLDSSV